MDADPEARGLLFVSVHGDLVADQLGRRQRARYEAGETVVRKAHLPGTNACVAFHPREYMTNALLAGVELLSYQPASDPAVFSQDAYLVRTPGIGAQAPNRS